MNLTPRAAGVLTEPVGGRLLPFNSALQKGADIFIKKRKQVQALTGEKDGGWSAEGAQGIFVYTLLEDARMNCLINKNHLVGEPAGGMGPTTKTKVQKTVSLWHRDREGGICSPAGLGKKGEMR